MTYTPNFTDYDPISVPANWGPLDRHTQDVTTERKVVGFFKAIDTRFGSATGWTVRVLETGNTWECGLKNSDGTYVLKQMVDTNLARLTSQIRRGLSLSDFAPFSANGTNWSPAWAAMMATASVKPNTRISANDTGLVILDQLNVAVPVVFDCATAEFLATGPNFLPDSNGKARPALNIKTTLGNGSFGDNSYFGKYSVLSGHLPRMRRIGNNSNFSDGSVGVFLCNAYYPHLIVSPIDDFYIGLDITGDSIGTTNQRGSSHGDYFLTHLANHINVRLECHGFDGSTSGGWITTNNFFKGGFGSPDFLGQNPINAGETTDQWRSRVIPDTHTHVVMIGEAIGWHYGNLFHDPYYENYGVRAFLCIGPMTQSGTVMGASTGYEMPEADRRGNAWVVLQANAAGGKPQSMVFGGIAKEKISGGGARYTRTSIADYQGWRESFDNVAIIVPAGGGPVTSPDSEWVLPSLLFQNPQIIAYTSAYTSSAQLQLDLRKYRRFLITLAAGVAITTGSITFINAPTTFDAEAEIMIQQDVAGNTIDAAWLQNIAYKSTEAPVLRAYGDDTYYFRRKLYTPQWQTVTHATGRPVNASASAAVLPVQPTRTVLTYTGTNITVDLATTTQTNYQVVVNAAMTTANAIKFINPPSGADVVLDIEIIQNSGSGGYSVHPQWLQYGTQTALRYMLWWSPRTRNYGINRYVIRCNSNRPMAVSYGDSTNSDPATGDLGTVSGTTLPTMNSADTALQPFLKTDTKTVHYWNANNNAWMPGTPPASSTVPGTVLKLSASSTLDYPSIPANDFKELTISLTGAVVGDVVSVGVPAGLEAGLVVPTPRVSTANTVTVRVFNHTAAAIDPAAASYTVQIVK